MNFDTSLGLHTSGRAAQRAASQPRAALLNSLGLGGLDKDAAFDEFAAETAAAFAESLGEVAAGLYAMVNVITDQQRFLGLHNPAGEKPVGRTMRRDHGYCPDVVDRGRALVLTDVYAWPRFAGNHVVDAVGIRTYAGAPIAHQPSSLVFGTVCVIGKQELPDDTETASLALIKDRAAQLAALIQQRTGQLITSEPTISEPGRKQARGHDPGAVPG